MKQLILMRHAKTETHSPSGEDRMRALTDRGRSDAETATQEMLEGFTPQHILCSDATRTTQTADIVIAHHGIPIAHDESLYLASPGTMLNAIHAVDDAVETLLVVGHNPGMHELAFSLAAEGEKEAMQRLSLHFPTSAYAVITGEWPAWSDVAPAGGTLLRFSDRKSL